MPRIRVEGITEQEAAGYLDVLRAAFEVRSVQPWRAWTRRDPHATTGAFYVDAVPRPPGGPVRATAVRTDRAEVDTAPPRALPHTRRT